MMKSILGGIISCVALASLAAQEPAQPPGRTIIGIVVDTAGRPVDSAQVTIESNRRQATTGRDGTFRFENLPPARYRLIARKVGAKPDVVQLVVGRSTGATARMQLTPFAYALGPAITTVRRLGLGGSVSDSALAPLGGATVKVVGAPYVTTSDSSGRFHMDVPPGTYALWTTLRGHEAQFLSVTVPPDSGRNIAIIMGTARNAGWSTRQHAAIADMDIRLARAHANWSKMYSRGDLLRLNVAELDRVAVTATNQRNDERCEALLNGGPERIPLWAVSAFDVEFLETYADDAAPGAPFRPYGEWPGGVATAVPHSAHDAPFKSADPNTGYTCPVGVVVWLRR